MINYIYLSIIIISLLLLNTLTYILVKKKYQKNQPIITDSLINNFTTYISILKFFMEEAYLVVYNNYILLNDIEGYKLEKKEKIKYSKDFVSLTFKLMGKNFEYFFIGVFGNKETLTFYMLRYFEKKEEENIFSKDLKKNSFKK